ncbi:Beta-catenin-like protein 1-like protein [Erysiphe neolycopersici]|uniref:Beta-catenin-like protein 1-like protein n=1 Tax=Erysiphe neolycopersici TaxID=212602 RepID=A0A420HT66_9PEZI|nr:Beta-catenin-like protein 1-like protein [Erysiphe neolycopersici]
MSSLNSLDDLFKKSGSSSLKRKLNDPRYSIQNNKYTKTTNEKPEAYIENNDKPEADSDENPNESYGPDIPDDEEGRFFGGGVSEKQKEILDYVDQQTNTDIQPERIDSSWLRKQSTKLEKKIQKNAELRFKFEHEPLRYMETEAELHAEIKALSILSEHPDLYGEVVKLGCIGNLVSLLTHENTDIVAVVLEIISELTDENVEAEQSQWNEIVNTMIEADLLSLIGSNFSRFNEKNESDRSGVYYSLNVFENLASMTNIAEKIGKDRRILNWLVSRTRRLESPVSQNKQYAAEVLAILLQSSTFNTRKFCEIDGINLFLELLANYRKRDPTKGTEEEEYVENLFDILTCAVNTSEGKAKFVEAEGVELCLIMIKEGKMSKSRALRLLDHCLGSLNGLDACERLVEAGGLKVIFSMFMKKQDGSNTEHLLGIFLSLLRLLTANSAYRIRTLAKFVEKDFEKIVKLINLRRDYASRLKLVDEDIKKDQDQLDEEARQLAIDDWLSKRLDAGLFCLQSIDVILAWLVAEDDGAYEKIKSLLSEQDENITLLSKTLNEQITTIVGNTEEENMTRDMLSTLVKFLT